MRSRRSVLLLVLGVVVLGGLVYAGVTVRGARAAETFICPLTGERLPCEKCCPLKARSRVVHDDGALPVAATPAEPGQGS
jgi:uncharacterized membrane protein